MKSQCLLRCLGVVYFITLADTQTPPSTGLYFMLNGTIFFDGASVLISDIGSQPADRTDPGSTLVCVTTNVNTACCRGSDGGALGEWRYPNGTLVPRPNNNPEDFTRFGFTLQVRLSMEVSGPSPPLGVYTCEVPYANGTLVTAIITLMEQVPAPPSVPTLISTTPLTTIISFIWTQLPSDVVDSYNISHTRTTDQCVGTPEFTSSGSVSGINGSMRSYSLTGLEEDSEYDITIEAVNGAGRASSTILTTRTSASAPSVPPVLRVTSATPTTISIAWDEIPCLMRNGRIYRYVVSFCHVSVTNCQSLTKVTDVSNRTLTFNNLIPRSSYNITIRADSEDSTFIPYIGSFSPPITADTAAPQDLGFFLDGVIYPPNVALDLTDIGEDGDSLRCLTPLIPCCRSADIPNSDGTLGDWIFPNGSLAPTGFGVYDISTKGASSIILHRNSNLTLPTGVYTCEIPDNSRISREVNVYLYAGQLTDLATTLEFISSTSQLICTVCGGLVDSYTWTRDGAVISGSDPLFTQTLTLTNSSTVTSQLVLSSANISSLVGTYQCTVTDGNGRMSTATQTIVPDDPLVIEIWSSGNSTAGEVYSLTCDVSLSQNLTRSPVIEWVGPDGNLIDNTTLRDVSLTSYFPSTTMTLLFNPLRTSHRGVYWCRATLTDMDANIMIMNNSSHTLIVQVPPAQVIIEGFPVNESFFIGLLLTLRARIALHPAVDSPGDIQVASSWTSPRAANSTGAVNSNFSPISYYNNLTINLQDSELDSGFYAVTVSILSASSCIIGVNLNGSRYISVEAFPPQRVTVMKEYIVPAGGMAHIFCNVERHVDLSSSTRLEIYWLSPNKRASGHGISFSSSVTFSLLPSNITTSQAGVYTCVVNMTIPGVVEDHQVRENSTVYITIPPATSVTLSESRPGPLYWGTSLTLTCIVNYDAQLVDTPVSFYINITGPQTNAVTTNTTANVSTAIFNPLLPVHDGSYDCSSSISPSSESLFVLPSTSASSSLLDLVLTELPVPVVDVSSAAVTEAGQFLSLTCRVDVVEYLTVDPQVEWRQPDGSAVTNTGNPSMNSRVNVIGRVSTLNVFFSPLLTSHAGEYQCRASIHIPSVPQIFVNNTDIEVYVQIPQPVISLGVDASTVQGTLASLTSSTVLDMLVVDSPVELTGSWLRQDGGTMYNQVTAPIESNRESTPYINSLQFSPLRSDSVDGGEYIYTVDISSRNSSYVLPAVSRENISLVVLPYPELNINTAVNADECQLTNETELSANVSLLSNTFSDRNVSFIWTRGTNEIGRESGPNTFSGSYMLADISESTMGFYGVEVCLTVFGSGLENHCSNTSIEIVASDPPAVRNLSCATQNDSLLLSWSPPVSGGVSMYRVSVQQIVQEDANTIQVLHLSPPFVVETVNQTILSPPLDMFLPYNIMVTTLNSAKCGNAFEKITCFTHEGVPSKGPQNVTVRRDPEDATVLVVSWEPLTIVEARGFITYEVVATPSSGSRKRQQQILRASVPYNVNTIRLMGADAAVFYTIIVAVCVSPMQASTPVNLSSILPATCIIDSVATNTVPAVAPSIPTPIPPSSDDSLVYIIIGAVAIVFLIIVAIVVIFNIILCVWLRRRMHKVEITKKPRTLPPTIPMSVRTSSQHDYEEIPEYHQTTLNSHQRSVASSHPTNGASSHPTSVANSRPTIRSKSVTSRLPTSVVSSHPTRVASSRSKSVNSRRPMSVASSRQMSGVGRPASTDSEGEFDISTYTCPAYAPTVPKNNKIQGEYITFRKKV